jgi:hypothetical protein
MRRDRRFFREHYDARRLLREVVEEVRIAPSFAEEESPRVATRIEAARRPEFVALLVRQPRETFYRTLSAVPPGAKNLTTTRSRLLGRVRISEECQRT